MEQEIFTYYLEGKWREVLDMLSGKLGLQFYNQKFLWIQPTKDDLIFIGEHVKKCNGSVIVSVGCGTGLLEWLIQCVTEVKIIGIEIDRQWWESKYAPPQFLPLIYADEKKNCSLSSSSAIMFCYFNNKNAFEHYMEIFKGNCLIVIGPESGSGRHTDPLPFDPCIELLGWKVVTSKQIQNTPDHIVIYERCR